MYKGIIHLEALTDPTVLKEMRIVKRSVDEHPEADTKVWHEYRVKVPDRKIQAVTGWVLEVIKTDWYSVFWNEENFYAVFSQKAFKIPMKDALSGNYEEAKKYGVEHGIQAEYIDLAKEIASW